MESPITTSFLQSGLQELYQFVHIGCISPWCWHFIPWPQEGILPEQRVMVEYENLTEEKDKGNPKNSQLCYLYLNRMLHWFMLIWYCGS